MDLFACDFIVIPVNKGAHWFLVIVCYAAEAIRAAVATSSAASSLDPPSAPMDTDALNRRPCILLLDSLGTHYMSAKSLAKTIQSYLLEEFRHKRGADSLPPTTDLSGKSA